MLFVFLCSQDIKEKTQYARILTSFLAGLSTVSMQFLFFVFIFPYLDVCLPPSSPLDLILPFCSIIGFVSLSVCFLFVPDDVAQLLLSSFRSIPHCSHTFFMGGILLMSLEFVLLNVFEYFIKCLLCMCPYVWSCNFHLFIIHILYLSV